MTGRAPMAARTAMWIALGGALCLPLQAASGAAPALYHSPHDDGSVPGPTVYTQVGGSRTLYLYGDGGPTSSATGVVCENGSGDEICGWDALVDARGGVTLTAFRPEGDVHYTLSATVLRFNVLSADGGSLGPTKLGELDVDTSAEGVVQLTGGQAVDAALGEHDLRVTQLLRVPEPPTPLGLLAGTALLALVGRRRSPRGRRAPTLANASRSLAPGLRAPSADLP